MKHTYILSMTVISILCSGCRPRTAPVERDHPKRRAVVKRKIAGDVIADAAASQIGVTVTYAPAYVALKYPGGDVPMDRGVCSDVVIRALRKVGMDLQKEIHEDMTANFGSYPKIWGLTRPDKNIDHRRRRRAPPPPDRDPPRDREPKCDRGSRSDPRPRQRT